MTMEFAPSSAPTTGPGKLSYAEKDSERANTKQQASTNAHSSAPPSLNFESSNLFHFGSSSDFFAPMKYDEEGLTTASSPTESGEENSSKEAANNRKTAVRAGNGDVLPPTAPPPSNQVSHEREEADTVTEATTVSSKLGRSIDIKVRKARPQMEGLPSHNSRRKNSIEMFLSQSPSQALGGDFLKLSLDDRQLSLQTNERAANGTSSVSGSGSATAPSVSSYATGQFQLNPVQESPSEYTPLGGHYGHQQSPAVTHQPQERYRSSSRDAQQQHLPTSLSLSHSSTVPGTSTAPNATYNGAYSLSPRMPSENSWSGSQDGDNNAMYQEQMQQEYYNNNQMAASYEQQQYRHHHHQQQPQQYRSPQAASGSYSYGGALSRAQMNPGQWNPMVVGPHPPSGMYDVSGNMYMNPRSSPMRHPHAQMGYGSQQQGSMGMRSGGHSNNRAQGRNVYSRITPPLPDSSPSHSPRKGMTMGGGMQMGMKQCKFFLQGHCRMGSKCKFMHQTGAPTPDHMGNGHNLNHQNGSMMYQQSRMMMPSPPTHMMQQQQRHQMNGDEASHQLNAQFGGRQQSRMNFRSENSGVSSMGLGLMNSGGMSAPMIGGSANDPSSLSAALSVEDIQNRVFAMSKDQNGCRLLQEQLDYEDRSDLCEVIYQESLEHLAEMMVDPFGNYLFQKLLERVNDKQRLVIIHRVSSNLVAAALNLHGTRSVQKVVEVCATSSGVIEEDYDGEDGNDYGFLIDREERPEGNSRRRTTNLPDIIVEALKDDAVRLCIDSNGNHVIQRALQFMKPEYNQFVFDAVCKECTTVGTHRHGCCVLQRCLDAANKTQKAEVIEQVERQAMKLMQDPYGNYVVQYVLDSCTAEEAFGVIMKPLGHIYELSVQKFSSNVIEKCLEKAPERVRQKYIAEITNCPKMNKMLQDQFANYVVQRALCVCAEEQCLLLVKAIRPHLAAMKNTSGGRRITARILKRFPNMDISMDMGMSPTTDNLFDHGGNGMMMGHLPSSSMGGYMQQQHLQPTPMYGMHGGPMSTVHHFQGSSRGSRMQQMHDNDGSMMMLNDVGGMSVNATSRV